MRGACAIGIAAVSVLVFGLVASAGDKGPDGQELYRSYCKPCHVANSPNGEYTPMTLIQDQWKRFFKDKYVRVHADVVDDKHDGRKVVDLITPEMLEKIKAFAIDHAADSEHPMTCGK